MTTTLIMCAIVAMAPATDPPLPTVKELTAHMDDLYRAKSSRGKMTMRVKTRHFSRALTVEAWSLGEDLSLMVIRQPAREAGTATLRTDKGLWNYAPRADRLMRIPSALLSESWMGSHFTNDDLMRETSWEDDYDTTLSWVTESGQRLLAATMVPKKDAAVVYTKVVMLLSEKGWLPVRTEYYDGKDVARSMVFSDVRQFGKRRIPATLTVVPSDKPEESTVVIYDEMEFDVSVPESLFTPAGLRKAANSR